MSPPRRGAGAILRAALVLAASVLPATAQDREATLADIRQQLAVLQVEIRGLTRELSTTGAPALGVEGTTFPDRVTALETQMREMSAEVERLSFRVESVARDGTTRIEDLRFQLCELTPDCDLAGLPAPGPLGGAGGPEVAADPASEPASGRADAPQLAVGERGEFEAAQALLDSGRTAEAIAAFDRFTLAYPSGPFSAQAAILKGRALARTGDHAAAARTYLDVFSGAPDGPFGAAALLGLGRALDALGQRDEACLTLAEIGSRFAASPEAAEAASVRASLGCP